MEALRKLDWSLLVDKIEPFAHKIQKLFGVNCFFLARLCMWLSLGCLVGSSALWFLGRFDRGITLFTKIIVCLGWVYSYSVIARIEELVARKHEVGAGNPFKVLLQTERIIFGTLVLITTLGVWPIIVLLEGGIVLALLETITWPLWALADYFECCDPLPPAKSKVKEWLEGLSSFAQGIFTPSPWPLPVKIPIPSR